MWIVRTWYSPFQGGSRAVFVRHGYKREAHNVKSAELDVGETYPRPPETARKQQAQRELASVCWLLLGGRRGVFFGFLF